jgi:hypothetical protein
MALSEILVEESRTAFANQAVVWQAIYVNRLLLRRSRDN